MAKNQIPELFFENPSGLPVEKLYLKIQQVKGGPDQVKAIDKFWVQERYYPSFSPIPKDDSDENKEKWLKRAKNFNMSLQYLLDLPFYKFWSNVLYDPQVPEMLDSFLQNAVPSYMPQPTDIYEEPYAQIYDLVFQIYSKILTPKLSETEFITPKALGKLLKDEKVVTNFTLWDICKLYGHIDDGTLTNLLEFAYENIPDLKEELVLVITCVSEIFEAIGTAAYEEESPTEKIVTRLTILLYDTAFAVNMFMKIYPSFKEICVHEDLFSRMIHTYDSEVPLLYLLMKSVFVNDDNPGYNRVDNARVEMLETCHNLTSYCMDMILQKSDNQEEQNKWIDMYLKFVTMVTAQDHFLTDFDRVYPITQDIEMLQAICPNIDQKRCDSILSLVVKHQVEEQESESKEAVQNVPEEIDTGTLDEATVPEHIVLESQITELLDVFPHLGDGFLEQCLIEMNMDSQAVIMAILEDNLPPNLAKLDRSLPRIPPELPEPGPSLEAVYIGKKPGEHKDFTELINDKSHVKELKERLLQNYSVTVSDDPLYDDDYDDRYDDDFTAGVDSVDVEEILKPKRRGRVSESESEDDEPKSEETGRKNRATYSKKGDTRSKNGETSKNAGSRSKYADAKSQNEEAKSENEETRPRDAFCEDPAIIRARREAKYQQNRRGQPQNKNKDLVGKPKGQGQEPDVQKNREKKNVNKSSRANHNRRQGAQWKRTRGMIPS